MTSLILNVHIKNTEKCIQGRNFRKKKEKRKKQVEKFLNLWE